MIFTEINSILIGNYGITCHLSIYTMDHSKFIVLNQKDPLGHERLTYISLTFFLWDINKRCRPKQTFQNAAPIQGFHCYRTFH